jgi:hypothetical protein
VAYNYLKGRSEALLAADLAALQDQYVNAQTIISTGSGDVTAAFDLAKDVQAKIERVYSALTLLNPTTYPAQYRVTRTKMVAYP